MFSLEHKPGRGWGTYLNPAAHTTLQAIALPPPTHTPGCLLLTSLSLPRGQPRALSRVLSGVALATQKQKPGTLENL